ncbi:MAG TPA: hypothetical protein VGJ13_20810 [Pseudonocardiaceae bacterium]
MLFPLYFQILHGQDVMTTGLSLFSLGLGTASALPLSGRLTDRYGGGIVSAGGSLLMIATTVPSRSWALRRARPWCRRCCCCTA